MNPMTKDQLNDAIEHFDRYLAILPANQSRATRDAHYVYINGVQFGKISNAGPRQTVITPLGDTTIHATDADYLLNRALNKLFYDLERSLDARQAAGLTEQDVAQFGPILVALDDFILMTRLKQGLDEQVVLATVSKAYQLCDRLDESSTNVNLTLVEQDRYVLYADQNAVARVSIGTTETVIQSVFGRTVLATGTRNPPVERMAHIEQYWGEQANAFRQRIHAFEQAYLLNRANPSSDQFRGFLEIDQVVRFFNQSDLYNGRDQKRVDRVLRSRLDIHAYQTQHRLDKQHLMNGIDYRIGYAEPGWTELECLRFELERARSNADHERWLEAICETDGTVHVGEHVLGTLCVDTTDVSFVSIYGSRLTGLDERLWQTDVAKQLLADHIEWRDEATYDLSEWDSGKQDRRLRTTLEQAMRVAGRLARVYPRLVHAPKETKQPHLIDRLETSRARRLRRPERNPAPLDVATLDARFRQLTRRLDPVWAVRRAVSYFAESGQSLVLHLDACSVVRGDNVAYLVRQDGVPLAKAVLVSKSFDALDIETVLSLGTTRETCLPGFLESGDFKSYVFELLRDQFDAHEQALERARTERLTPREAQDRLQLIQQLVALGAKSEHLNDV